MISPEEIRPAPTPTTRNRRRFAPLVLAAGVALTSGSMSAPQKTFPNPISNPDQPVFAYYYGTIPLSQSGTMIDTGNVEDNARPINGIEYGEEDIQNAFRQLKELRDAGVDGITISWHSIGDARDQDTIFLVNQVLPDCRNPFPGVKIKLILESLANLNVDNSDIKLDQKMEHLWSAVLNSPFYFRNEDGLPEIEFFTGDNPIWIDGIPVDKTLVRLGKDFGIHPVMRDYVGSNIDEIFGIHPDAQNLDKFPYGFPFYKLSPSGLEQTAHQAMIILSYHKVVPSTGERDFKSIDYQEDKAIQNIRKARSSNARRIGIPYNEGVEDTDFEGDPAKIALLGKELYDPEDQATRDVFPIACKPSPQSSTVIVEFPQPIPYPFRKAS